MRAKFIDGEDIFEGHVIMVAPDVTMELNGGELTFRKVPPVTADQNLIEINLNECPVCNIVMDTHIELDLIKNGSFLNVVRKLAK